MLTIKVNKSFCVAGAFCALAMNINTALGITEAEFNEKHDRLVKKLIPMRENFQLSEQVTEWVARRAGFSTAKGDEAYSVCYLLCLGYSPNVILWLIKEENVSPTTVISALRGSYGDLKPDMHEILDSFVIYSEEWELDLSWLGHYEAQFDPENFRTLTSRDLMMAILPTNRVDHVHAEAFVSELVRGNNFLKVLLLNNLGFYSYPITSIFEALRDDLNSTLEKIDLSGNFVETDGMVAVAETLKTNTSLNTLVLVNCGIMVEGIVALSVVLPNNTSLNSLDMRENLISDIGREALAKGIEGNNFIISLKY